MYLETPESDETPEANYVNVMSPLSNKYLFIPCVMDF